MLFPQSGQELFTERGTSEQRLKKGGNEWCGCLGEEHSSKDLRWKCVWSERGTAGRPGSLEQRGSEWQEMKSARYQGVRPLEVSEQRSDKLLFRF